MRDVYTDRVVGSIRISMTSPDMGNNFFPTYYYLRVFHEYFQQYLLCSGQVHEGVSDKYFPMLPVETDGFVVQDGSVRDFIGSSEDGFDSCYQFIRQKGFYDVVIRTTVESENLVLHIVVSGYHNDRS